MQHEKKQIYSHFYTPSEIMYIKRWAFGIVSYVRFFFSCSMIFFKKLSNFEYSIKKSKYVRNF